MTAEPDPFALAVWTIYETEKAARRSRKPAELATDWPTDQPPAADPFADSPQVITDPAKYAASALSRAVEEFGQLGADRPDEGAGRNHALNATAFSLGRLVGAELLDADTVEDALLAACELNGLQQWTGTGACLSTIRSGLTSGIREPIVWVQGAPAATSSALDPFGTGLVPQQQAAGAPEVERTSWWPRNLTPILNGDAPEEQIPTYLFRADGIALFYAGKVNGLIGESESGKTWVALIAVAQTLKTGHAVLYLDFEDTAVGIIGRLRALGVDDESLAHLVYVSPDESLHGAAERDLQEVMRTHQPPLVILDGYNAAMTLLGLQLQDNTDVTAFSLRVLRPIKRTGSCVITIDHVTKSKDGRGTYAIGAQAKRADVDGCLIIVEVSQPFGRGQIGRLKLTVSKDRPGHVRASSGAAKHAGEAVLRSSADGTVVAIVDGPDLRPAEERGPFRPTVLMQRVSAFLGAMAEPTTRNIVKKSVTGKDQAILQAIDVLIEEGFVKVVGAGKLVSERPFEETSDPFDDSPRAPAPRVPGHVPGGSREHPSPACPVPPPLGGNGNGAGEEPDDVPPWWQR